MPRIVQANIQEPDIRRLHFTFQDTLRIPPFFLSSFSEPTHQLGQLRLRRPGRHLLLKLPFAAHDARLLSTHWRWSRGRRVLTHLYISGALIRVHLGRTWGRDVSWWCVPWRWLCPRAIRSHSVGLLLLLKVGLLRIVRVLILCSLSVLRAFLVGNEPLFNVRSMSLWASQR